VSKLFTAMGLMSGTSLDGIDVAMIQTDGKDAVEHVQSRTYSYSTDQQQMLRQALEDAKSLTSRDARPGILDEAERALTGWHAEAVEDFLRGEEMSVDLIGFHGQTVLHKPEMALTVQLGLGRDLARKTGIPVVYDLRAADVASGGQGAPLVPIYHRALAAKFAERPVAFINIGGVANITWVGEEGELIAFDTGPGNALLNDWAMKHLGEPQDTDGRLALAGKADEGIIDKVLSQKFFVMPPPKSLDRNAFQGMALDHLSPEDGAATLVELTRASILISSDWMPRAAHRFIVCGGGRHNPAIMKSLPKSFQSAEDAELNGDAIEAEAWAYLAVRSKLGLPITFPMTTGVKTAMTGGVLALP
jgi:anhydro-N-acetylmuramic acid kinase